MLYLIKNHQGLVKIGHTINIDNRIKSYINHGAEITLIDTCEGNITLERRLQAILYNKGLHLFSEWFKEDPIVYKIWDMAKNKKWKPVYYIDALNETSKKNNGNSIYDIYIYNPTDIRHNFMYTCVKPRIKNYYRIH
jgi:ribosomal protein S16